MLTLQRPKAESGAPWGEPSPMIRASRERLAGEELLLLREAIKLLGKRLDPGVIIREILHLLSELLGLNRGRVVMPDPDGNTLSIRHAYGLTAVEVARGRYGFGEGVIGKVMVSGEPQIVQDIDAESGYLGHAFEGATLPQETVAFIAVPICDDCGVCGVLAAHRLRRRKRAFADDLAVLQSLAALIGQALQMQRLLTERLVQFGAGRAAAGKPAANAAGHHYQRVESADRDRIEQALQQTGGNKSRAAQLLGLTLRQFNYRYKVLGLRD